MPEEYEVHVTFNVTDLIPFTGRTDDEAKFTNLRTNPFQEGGDNARRPKKGPTTRAMAKRIHVELEIEPSSHSILFSWSFNCK